MKRRIMTSAVAVVTGGARGLGRAVALALFEYEYRVAVNYLRSGREAGELAAGREERILPVKADVSSFAEVKAMAEAVSRTWGPVKVLVNNAGITRDALLVKQREEDWDRVLAVNLKGAFNTIKAFVPLMGEGGHIINIASYSGIKGKAGQAAYSASKAALIGLTTSAAHELAGLDIRVNALLPGYMPTSMGAYADSAMKRAAEEHLLKTLSDPDEAARFVVYLAGTRTVTGQVFSLDGRIL
jgi:3-oxoacyl-[acyl-carrier protein] reductase